MLRNLILAVLCLMTISILFSNSGISPNGHRYNPRYVQCESFATVNEIKPNRDYEIPYLYTRDAQIRLVFEKPDCMPSYRDASISYSDAMLHDYTLSNVNMFAFNLNNIVVSNAGSGSFLTINAAMDFITDFLASGLYTGEPIRIKVSQETPETYVESVDLSPLASYNVTNFTLEGVGEVIIEGVITLNCSAGSMLQEAEYIIKGLNFTNSTQGIVFTDTWDDSLSEVHIPNIKLSIENCSIYACGTSLNISN
ncbi:MAG: hypothetical protein RBS43_11640, partial [Candidatus Cloacimonas sp.]|nr:hypothetical protein [Candidatus Cloacimonas sp.]